MTKKVVCAKCGKQVDWLCANCWRCKDCGDEYCKDHMKRKIDGKIGIKK